MTDFDPDAFLANKPADAPPQSAAKPDPAVDRIQVQQFDPDAFLQQGSVPAGADESLLEQIGTGAEHVLNAGTLGLSGVVETHGIPFLHIPAITTPEARAARTAKYPITSGFGDVGGTAGLIGLTGGLGGGLAAEAGLAAKAGVGALEGAGIGAATSATDDWSNNKPLDAQKIVASAGIGGLLGTAGPAIVGAAKGATGVAGKALDYFGKLAESAAQGEGYTANLAKAYLSAGSKSADMVSSLTEHLSDLYKSGKSAVNSMYEGAAQTKLGSALESLPLGDAKALAEQTLEKVKAITIPGDNAEPLSGLSRASSNIITSNMEKLSTELSQAESSLDVHNAMTDFATAIDKGIKFDTLPTAAQKVDQDLISGVRSVVRGDLKNPDLWGQSAPIYSELSDNYTQYKSARKNFERDFTKSRTAPNGQMIKEVDPAKVNALFNNPEAAGQVFKNQSLDDFIASGSKNAQYANEFGGFQKGLDDLTDQIAKSKDFLGKAEVLKQIKLAKAEHKVGIGLFASLSALPLPLSVKASILALERFKGTNGAYIAGSDLGASAQLASGLVKKSAAVTSKLEAGVNALFGGAKKASR